MLRALVSLWLAMLLAACGTPPTAGAPAGETEIRYGRITSIQPMTIESDQKLGLGAVLGAVAGGLLGNQIGGGTGKDVATVAAALVGGHAGQKTRTSTPGSRASTSPCSWRVAEMSESRSRWTRCCTSATACASKAAARTRRVRRSRPWPARASSGRGRHADRHGLVHGDHHAVARIDACQVGLVVVHPVFVDLAGRPLELHDELVPVDGDHFGEEGDGPAIRGGQRYLRPLARRPRFSTSSRTSSPPRLSVSTSAAT